MSNGTLPNEQSFNTFDVKYDKFPQIKRIISTLLVINSLILNEAAITCNAIGFYSCFDTCLRQKGGKTDLRSRPYCRRHSESTISFLEAQYTSRVEGDIDSDHER